MYAGIPKEKKLLYERTRRAKNRVETREARVLKPWLQKKYPEVYAQFMFFYDRMDRTYPSVKNLAVTREFKQFIGMFAIF
jgi:hypothetical protein